MSITIYGISNCDTVSKAKKWLTENEHEFTFHDFRKQGIDAEMIKPWLAALGASVVLNKRGTTWRGLDDATKQAAEADENILIELLVEHSALIKRPILVTDTTIQAGFKPEWYAEWI